MVAVTSCGSRFSALNPSDISILSMSSSELTPLTCDSLGGRSSLMTRSSGGIIMNVTQYLTGLWIHVISVAHNCPMMVVTKS